jgi:hypothetical protein
VTWTVLPQTSRHRPAGLLILSARRPARARSGLLAVRDNEQGSYELRPATADAAIVFPPSSGVFSSVLPRFAPFLFAIGLTPRAACLVRVRVASLARTTTRRAAGALFQSVSRRYTRRGTPTPRHGCGTATERLFRCPGWSHRTGPRFVIKRDQGEYSGRETPSTRGPVKICDECDGESDGNDGRTWSEEGPVSNSRPRSGDKWQ